MGNKNIINNCSLSPVHFAFILTLNCYSNSRAEFSFSAKSNYTKWKRLSLVGLAFLMPETRGWRRLEGWCKKPGNKNQFLACGGLKHSAFTVKPFLRFRCKFCAPHHMCKSAREELSRERALATDSSSAICVDDSLQRFCSQLAGDSQTWGFVDNLWIFTSNQSVTKPVVFCDIELQFF